MAFSVVQKRIREKLSASKNLAFWAPPILLTPLMLIYHRQMSSGEIRDLGVWISAGESIANGFDPYTQSSGLFKSGPISPLVFLLVRTLFFNNDLIFFNLLMTLNILGGILFFQWYERSLHLNSTIVLVISTTICLGSFTREVLVNGQVTGIIFGGIAALAKLVDSKLDGSLKTLTPIAIVSITTFLIDLKPNLTLFLLLYILITSNLQRKIAYIGMTFFVYVTLFIYLSFSTKSNLIMSWFSILLNLNDRTINDTLFGSVNIWQIFNLYSQKGSNFDFFLTYAPLLIYITIGIAGLSLAIRRNITGLNLVILAPFFYSYWHYYSFLPLIMVILAGFAYSKNLFLLGIAISFSLVSFFVTNNLIPLFVLGVSIVLVVIFLDGFRNWKMFIAGFLVSSIFRSLLEVTIESDILLKSIYVTTLVFIWLVFSFNTLIRSSTYE